MNTGGLGNFQHVFSLHNRAQMQLQIDDWVYHYLGASIPKNLSRMRTYRSSHRSRKVELQYFRVVSDNLWHRGGPFNFTCIVISTSVSGAGLTSVVSCAAADVMSAPADWMEGCMRGASDSGLNVESGEGKVKELVETTASICSIDDCMILARVFSSVKASWDTLQRKAAVKHFNIEYV